jgi:uncharacterized protein YcfL
MKNALIILSIFTFLAIGCKSDTELDNLKTKAMTMHDEVMPKTMKISEIKKQVLAKADTQDDAAKDKAQSINEKLQKSEDLMYTWMDELGTAMNTEGDNDAKLKAYQSLVKSVEKIKTDTESALNEADGFLKGVKK